MFLNQIIGVCRQDYSNNNFCFSKAVVTKNIFALCVQFSKWTNMIRFVGISIRVLLGFFTAMIILMAIKEYQSGPTITTANVEQLESMTLPTTTICLPLNFGELNNISKEQKRNYSLDEYLQKQNMTKDDFVPENKRWDNTVRNVVHAFLIDISYCETLYYYYCNEAFASDKDLVTAMDTLQMIISKLNISIDELRQKFGKEVAALYSLNISLYDFKELIEDVNSSRTDFIADGIICYDIQFNLYPLKFTSYFTIDISEHSLPNPFDFGVDRSAIHGSAKKFRFNILALI